MPAAWLLAGYLAIACAGESALHQAVEKGERKLVEQLLTSGADITVRTESGETVLHYAAFPKDAWFATRLIAAGADPRALNNAGESPLFWSALEGNVAVARTLLRQRADANARDAKGNLGCTSPRITVKPRWCGCCCRRPKSRTPGTAKDLRRATTPPRAGTRR